MRNRPLSTTSERELILAMAASGRTATLATLAGWRREGLLPPLASHGRGMGKGKSYYWKEPNIRSHASAAFDFLRKYGRPEIAVWMLWLSGFPVPLRQLRCVWAYRSKMRKMWTARPTRNCGLTPDFFGPSGRSPLGNLGDPAPLLLKAILALSGSLVPDDGDSTSIVEVIERALVYVSRSKGHSDFAHNLTAQRLWLVLRIVSSALENSDFVSIATDDELGDAQRYVRLAGVLFSHCDDRLLEKTGEAIWPSWIAERMAAPVFLFVLVLLRFGYKPLLERLAVRLEKIDRSVQRRFARHSYSAAQA